MFELVGDASPRVRDDNSTCDLDPRQDARKKRNRDRTLPISTIGRFSFGPATQTTVVTTTTTTTTKFPPLVMPAPHHSDDLDPKVYPLAGSPTPVSLRKIHFPLDGKNVVFQEWPDAAAEIEQTTKDERLLQQQNNMLRQIRTRPDPTIKQEQLSNATSSILQKLQERPASLNSVAELGLQHEWHLDMQSGAKRSRRSGKQPAFQPQTRSHTRLRAVHTSNPVTPEARSGHDQEQVSRSTSTRGRPTGLVLPSPLTEQQPLPLQSRSLSREDKDGVPHRFTSPQFPLISARTLSRTSYDSVVPTPPVEPEDAPLQERRLSARALSSIPTRLHVSQSPSVQDGTLPSPSLSPVTASVSAQPNEYFADADTVSDYSMPWHFRGSHLEDTPSHGRYESPAMTETGLSDADSSENEYPPVPSLRDIPSLLTFFEALPEGMKSYVMHQLLRRCPKSTLHVVADVVNPVLKCDFLTLLPAELAVNVIKYLDVQSLCRASQVSKKWRQMLNSDERAWKELFEADGFVLPEGELQRAISQGWGWQDPVGPDGWEVDIGEGSSSQIESELDSSGPSSLRRAFVVPSLRRSKRKAATQLTNRNKIARHRVKSRASSIDMETGGWMAQMSTAEGPYNAANAAILAVPYPELTVPSLKGLHLYKSLYRRHHFIRRNWMTEETKPHHLAFRAHGSHVVTCLQFDTDKILTGSDDSIINVYDTKTGRLRKLLKGHDGGVWALQYMGNTLVSGSTDRSVRVWDVEAGVETHVFRGHTSTVRCLQILMPTKTGETVDGKDIVMPRQPLIITGSRDSTLRVWKLPKSTDASHIQTESDAEAEDSPFFVRTLSGHTHSVRAIAAHADTLVSGSYDHSVRVWKISTGETVYRLTGHSAKVYSVVLDHKRNRCISGSMDYLVKIWSLETGSALYTLEGHTSLVGLLDLNCDRLVSAAADSTLRIWDPENGQCKSTLTAHAGAITCFQHDAQKVISGSERTLKMWDITTGYCKKDLLSDLSGVWQVKFNDRRCVAAVQRGNMTFIEVLDFGAARDGIPAKDRGRRLVVDELGQPAKIENDADADV